MDNDKEIKQLYPNIDNSEQLKQLYLEAETHHKEQIDKLKLALSCLSDNSFADTLLDSMSYTNATYNILKMQYLILYITLYLSEKKIVQNNNIPINTSLKILIDQDWISDNTKNFLKKHLFKALKDNVDYSVYVKDFDTYIKYSKIFN